MAVGTKKLGGAEDLMFGQGTVDQDRGGQDYTISKINASIIPFSGDVETGDFVSVKTVLAAILAAGNLDAVVEW